MRREQAPDPARERLTRLHRRRDAPVAMRAGEQARRQDACDPEIHRCLERHLAGLDEAIAAIETAIQEHLARHAPLTRAVALLTTTPGVGPVTAGVMVALLPELAAGKPRKLALIAVARKLLTILNAIMRTNTPFHPQT